MAEREYEAWFIASQDSFRDLLDFRVSAPESNPQSIRGAKEWITTRMAPGRIYSETVDQLKFTKRMDLQLARRASSFDKLWREIAKLKP